jgi:sialic acid synthase SpsE
LTEKERSSTVFRRSLFAIKDINEGDIISEENVRSIRPGYGIKPKYFESLKGKPAKKSVKRGEPITEDML